MYHQSNHLLPGHLVRWEKKRRPWIFIHVNITTYFLLPQSSVVEILLKIQCIKIKIEITIFVADALAAGAQAHNRRQFCALLHQLPAKLGLMGQDIQRESLKS